MRLAALLAELCSRDNIIRGAGLGETVPLDSTATKVDSTKADSHQADFLLCENGMSQGTHAMRSHGTHLLRL
jgi:hypothetical protein